MENREIDALKISGICNNIIGRMPGKLVKKTASEMRVDGFF